MGLREYWGVQEYWGLAEAALRPVQRLSGRVLRHSAIEERAGRRLAERPPKISDLGIIGDRRTAAVVTAKAQICWFCPGRVDAPSLFNLLIDPDAGGFWSVTMEGAEPAGRRYLGHSGVLETSLRCPGGRLTVTDWMPAGEGPLYHGAICRSLGPAPADVTMVLAPNGHDGRSIPFLQRGAKTQVVIDRRFRLQASHPVEIEGAKLVVRIPKGAEGWAVLADNAVASPNVDAGKMRASREATLAFWEGLAGRTPYDGPFAAEAQASLRALRLLTYEPTGAVAAAVTMSLPEFVGGARNFDYRYSWLRDSGMIIRAMVRFDPECLEARHYLEFVAGLLDSGYQSPLDPISAVGSERVPKQRRLRVAGYRGGHPNPIGNKAAHQLQLGSLANLVLSASEIYGLCGAREHWPVVRATAEALRQKWRDPGNGIWEESQKRHYTSSLVLSACALERIARHGDAAEATGWQAAAQEIRGFVETHCRRAGVFVADAQSHDVDISAALFPTWGYVAAEEAGMVKTIETLDRQYGVGRGLYHRHLQNPKVVEKEGAFLAGTFWVAHYWIARGDAERGRRLIEQGLSYGNDLGLFSEEFDSRSGEALGNMPLGLVHGSFLSALADLQELGRKG